MLNTPEGPDRPCADPGSGDPEDDPVRDAGVVVPRSLPTVRAIRAAQDGGDDDGPARDAVRDVARLRDGEWSSALADRRPRISDLAIAQLLDRVEESRLCDVRRSGGTTPRPSDAVHDWTRELVVLLAGRPGSTSDGDAELVASTLRAGEEAAQALVTGAGADWVGGNYRNLFRAARIAAGHEHPWGVAPERPSGVVSTASELPAGNAVEMDPGSAPQVRLRGRREILGTMMRTVRHGAPSLAVLVGAPGVGKSAVAQEVGRRAARDGIRAFWLQAQDPSALLAGLERVAVHLELPLEAMQRAHRDARGAMDHVQRLWRLLGSVASPWLVVLDDLEDLSTTGTGWSQLPRGVGHVVVTTRRCAKAVRAGVHVYEVGELGRHDAAQLLLDRFDSGGLGAAERGETAVLRLGALLPRLPLALVGIGDLLARTGPDDLVTRMERIAASPWDDAVRNVYEVSLGALEGRRSDGRVLLRLLSCFAADELLRESTVAGIWERVWEDDVDGVDELVRVGLVERLTVAGIDCLRLHPAVAECSRADFGAGTEVLDLDVRAVELLEAARAATDWGRPSDWPAVVALEPHVRGLVESPAFVNAPADLQARVLRLADRTATALLRSGRHACATALVDRAVGAFVGLGQDHPAVLAATLTRHWMVALDRGGNLPRARAGLEELVDACDRVLGHAHPTTTAAMDTLAWVLAEQDELSAAMALLEEVIDLRVRHGEPARQICGSRHRRAWVLVMAGAGRSAVDEFERVLAERTEILGPGHLDVLSTRYRLAWALSRLREHTEARRQFDLLLTQSEEALGDEHPLSLMVRSRVAWSAMWAGELDTARTNYERLIPEQEKVLGPNHPRVFVNAHNLATVTMRMGDPSRAEEDLRSVVAAREELLGSDHPLSMDSREMHAWALFRSGRAEEADRELLALLADRRRVLGDDHVATLDARLRIARVVLHRGRLSDAEGRLRELVADASRVLGDRDPRVLRTRHALALSLGLQSDHARARAELHAVLAAQTLALGDHDEDTLATRDRLVWQQGAAGRYTDLVDTAVLVLEDRSRILGAEHPHTMTSRYRWAWALLKTRRLDAAARTYEDLVDDLEQVFDPDHPHTLRARIGRCQLRRVGRRLDDLRPEVEDLVERLTRTQGPLAVATLRAEAERAQIEADSGRREVAARLLHDIRLRQQQVIGSNHRDVRRFLWIAESTSQGRPVSPGLEAFPVR